MRAWQQAVLGAVQGVAEVHPVSSSAQLTLLPWLLRWEPPADRTRFAAGLHAGSAAGLALALRHDLTHLGTTDRRRLALSTVPAVVAGALGQRAVEARLGRPGPTAGLLALGGLALWWADARPGADRRTSLDRGSSRPPLGGLELPRSPERSPERPSGPTQAWTGGDVAAAALAQVPALAPGVSRTGATLTALRARGVDRESAYRLSLLMSLPVTIGAAALTAVRGRTLPPAAPSALAAASAYLTARSLRASRTTVTAAVAYRLLLAAAVAARLRRAHPNQERA